MLSLFRAPWRFCLPTQVAGTIAQVNGAPERGGAAMLHLATRSTLNWCHHHPLLATTPKFCNLHNIDKEQMSVLAIVTTLFGAAKDWAVTSILMTGCASSNILLLHCAKVYRTPSRTDHTFSPGSKRSASACRAENTLIGVGRSMACAGSNETHHSSDTCSAL